MRANDPFRSAQRGVPPGTRLNGIYEIDQMIGVGGMGEVYKGHEIQTGTAVAIKMLVPEMAENEAALAFLPVIGDHRGKAGTAPAKRLSAWPPSGVSP